MKIFFLSVITILGLYSCTNDVNTDLETVSLNSKGLNSQVNWVNVKLNSAWTSNESSPIQKKFLRRFSVRVKNLAFKKEVFVHHLTTNGDWVDIPLSYKQNIPIGYEIWEGEVAPDTPLYGDTFAIKYVVDGNTYWDNNGGNDYSMPVSIGAYLAPDVQIILDSYNTRVVNRAVIISADVRINQQATYESKVEVVYTTDGWATTQKTELRFNEYYRVGYSEYILSPNQYEISKYETKIRLEDEAKAIEYYVIYTVDGQEYRDNNYGNNYLQTNLDPLSN